MLLKKWACSVAVVLVMASSAVALATVTAAPAAAAVVGDDYPANLRNATQDAIVDPWRFYNRECTSFVAWRLNNQNGFGFSNYYGGVQWGNADNWANAARAVGVRVDSTPEVGAVAWRSSGHVAWVAEVNGDGTITTEDYNSDYHGHYAVHRVSATSYSGYLHVHDIGSTPPADGSFVSYGGNVYRLAGGAPVYVSSWDPFGGQQPTTALSDAQGNALGATPRDGTLVTGQSTGQVYRFVGGAPLYVSSWDALGGQQPTVAVDQFALDNPGDGVLGHVRRSPADGAIAVGGQTGQVYRFAGGAPLYVSSWDAIGGIQPSTVVDQVALDNGGISTSPWLHVRDVPADGTFVVGGSTGQVFRFAGGAPLYVGSWGPFGGPRPTTVVDQFTLDHPGDGSPLQHVRARPADGTFIAAGPAVYRVSAGAAHWVPSWDPYGGEQPSTVVDPSVVENAGLSAPFDRLLSTVATPGAVPAAAVRTGSTAGISWTPELYASSAVTTSDVRWRSATPTSAWGAWQTDASRTGLTTTTSALTGIPAGSTRCWSVRAHNKAAQTSAWSPSSCTTRRADDTVMRAVGPWTTVSGGGLAGGSARTTTTAGAQLVLDGLASVNLVALTVTTCPGCGTVRIAVGGATVATLSLVSATTKNGVSLSTPRFSARAGALTVTVTSSRKTVTVDAVAAVRSG